MNKIEKQFQLFDQYNKTEVGVKHQCSLSHCTQLSWDESCSIHIFLRVILSITNDFPSTYLSIKTWYESERHKKNNGHKSTCTFVDSIPTYIFFCADGPKATASKIQMCFLFPNLVELNEIEVSWVQLLVMWDMWLLKQVYLKSNEHLSVLYSTVFLYSTVHSVDIPHITDNTLFCPYVIAYNG